MQKEVGIERIHLEQDAGKSIHDMDPTTSFVDLNRTGIALMEIVSKPEIKKYSGEIIYIDNRPEVTRASNQREDIKKRDWERDKARAIKKSFRK